MSSNFLHTFFNFSFYICYTPFRLKRQENGYYIRVTCFAQQVICGICNIVSLSVYLIALRHAIRGMKEGTPVIYFRLFENIFSVMYKSSIVYCFWMSQDDFLKIVNFSANNIPLEKRIPKRKRRIESTSILLTICAFHLMMAVARLSNPSFYPLSQIPNRQATCHGRFHDFYHAIVSESEYLFYQTTNHSLYDTTLTFTATYSPKEIFLACVTTYILGCKYIMGGFTDLGVVLAVLTLWVPVDDFERFLKSSKSNIILNNFNAATLTLEPKENLNSISKHQVLIQQAEADLVVETYNSLRQLSKMLNKALGLTLIAFLGEGIFTYAINFKDILFLGTMSQGMVVCAFYTIFILILLMASNICQKVQTVREWIYENEKRLALTCRETTLLLDSMSRDSVGIAIPGVAVINFSLVGTLTSILFTYFIIKLQYKE